MTIHVGLTGREATTRRSLALAPTCRGLNYYSIHLLLNEAPVPLSRAAALLVR